MSRSSVLRDSIIALLRQHGPLTTRQVCDFIYTKPDSDSTAVKKSIAYMVRTGVVDVDKSMRGRYRYVYLGKTARRQELQPLPEFKIPAEMRGKVLNPMAWSMAYLLGAAC